MPIYVLQIMSNYLTKQEWAKNVPIMLIKNNYSQKYQDFNTVFHFIHTLIIY